MGENGNSSIYSALLLAYVASLPAYKGQQLIGTWGAVVAALISIFTVVAFGALSDRVGRVPVYRWGALFTAVFAFPAFWLLTLGQVWLVLLVMGVGIGIGVQSMLGPQCALLPELFGNAHRFTGVATAREFSAVIAGGIAPWSALPCWPPPATRGGSSRSTPRCWRSSRSARPTPLPRPEAVA